MYKGVPPTTSLPQVRTALTLEAKEEARRFFDQERVKLLQEITELKSTKKQTDEALSNMIQADKMKAGDLRVEHQLHQEQISKIKWDCERDIRRLVRPCMCPACSLVGLVYFYFCFSHLWMLKRRDCASPVCPF